jgi:chromosome transmission fidelity protein 1
MCVFFASYALLQQAISMWENTSVLATLQSTKALYIEERERGAPGIEKLLRDYAATPDSCLFAVVGGRLSEGINLSDGLCRTLVVVGLPYLNERDPETAERVALSGSKYLQNQCMRRVNQTIGRALRHANDYAYILLVDQRYTLDTIAKDLPYWVHPSLQSKLSFPHAFSRAVKFFKSIIK